MRYRHIFKTTFSLKMQITSKSHDRFFPKVQQIGLQMHFTTVKPIRENYLVCEIYVYSNLKGCKVLS